MGKRRRRLRFRVMAAFALGGLTITASLSTLAYLLTRTYVLGQRQTSAMRQARANGQLVDAEVQARRADPSQILSSFRTAAGSQPILLHGGEWFGTTASVSADSLPAPLRATVLDDRQPASQRYRAAHQQLLAVGLPLSGGDGYFEVFNLRETYATLNTLRASLAAASLLGFLVSLGIGAWATRRVFRPLRDIGQAAGAIALGQLDARLDVQGDAELVELANGFNAMVESLQRRIERDARFASDVSHELRSPLTTLSSAVEVMQHRRGQLDDRTARALDLLSGEVNRFRGLVEDLLEISRYDAGAARLELEPVNLVGITTRLLADCGQEQATVEVRGAATRPVLADRRRTEQAVRNLVDNAIRHGGGVASVLVDVEPEGTELVVEDRGPGVPEGERTTIFERFARGRNAERHAGSGLGLAVATEHIRLQGGTISVDDAQPCGSRFTIRLPSQPAAEPPDDDENGVSMDHVRARAD